MNVSKVAVISLHTCPLAVLGEGKAGGMNVYVKELSRQLGGMGIEVDIFTRCHSHSEGEAEELDTNVRVVHLKAGPPEAEIGTLHSYLETFLEALRRFSHDDGRDYDLVHSHYWLSGWVGSKASASWDVPHVVTFHTLAQIKMQAKAGEGESPLRSRIEGELMASARLIVASSPNEKEAMVRLYGAPEERIQVVPCGVDLSLFRPLDAREARRELGLNGEKIVLYVGRVEPIKGLDLLLHSAAIMDRKSLKVMVIGGDLARETEVNRLKGLAHELGIEENLEFVGVVDQRHLPLYYSAADVCAVPSYYESFGLVALEALACGLPVVASRVGGLPAVVQHGRTGYLLSWRCPEPFADSLEVVLSNNGLRKSMSLAARERAEGMGWELVAAEICGLYSSL